MAVKVKLISEGVRELLKSPEIMAVCENTAAGVASRAGGGYTATPHQGKKRGYVNVYATDDEAYKDNMQNNTLLKALWG